MNTKTVSVDNMLAGIQSYLEEFQDATFENVKAACEETSDTVLKELKADSPRRTGRYAKGWRATMEVSSMWARVILHDTQYRLVHLLEHGHALVNGGRTRPIPHVAPAQDHADDLFQRILKERIEAGK